MVAIAAAAAVFASAFDLDATNVAVADKWAVWKSQFAMHGADPAHAFAKFAATEARILAHNAQGRSWTLGHNQFSDLAPAEFQALYIGGFNPRGARPKKYANVTASSSAALLSPDSIDWVAKGALPAVKDQAQCGGCWAFATVGAVEGAFQIAGNPLTSLSEQELISCDHSGDQGCNGGTPDYAFQWIETNNGLPTERAYPYTSASGNSGTCATGKTPLVTVASYTDVPQDDSQFLAAIAIGPVAVAIEADKSAFQSYSSGILDNPACGTVLDHAVLAVGYGTDGGVDYYKVRNSWGGSWGEAGYIRMVRGNGKNQCGILLQASYPTGVTALGPILPTPPPAPTPCTSCKDLPRTMTGFQCDAFKASECSGTTITCDTGQFSCSSSSSGIDGIPVVGLVLGGLAIGGLVLGGRACGKKKKKNANDAGYAGLKATNDRAFIQPQQPGGGAASAPHGGYAPAPLNPAPALYSAPPPAAPAPRAQFCFLCTWQMAGDECSSCGAMMTAMDTSNIAKYSVGQKVSNMGTKQVSGVVSAVIPASFGATGGPGQIVIFSEQSPAAAAGANTCTGCGMPSAATAFCTNCGQRA